MRNRKYAINSLLNIIVINNNLKVFSSVLKLIDMNLKICSIGFVDVVRPEKVIECTKQLNSLSAKEKISSWSKVCEFLLQSEITIFPFFFKSTLSI